MSPVSSTKLTKAGERFYDFQTGEAYNPTNPLLTEAQFTLTAPDGTRYKVHATNGITEQQFTDGKTFILSDSGLTAVNTGEAIQFVWGEQGLSSITGPDGHRIVYTYDQQGNLVSARDLSTGDTSRYGYDAQQRLTLVTETGQPGQAIEYPSLVNGHSSLVVTPVKADLGAAITYLQTPYQGTLTAGATDQLVFAVRPSEVIATNSGDVYVGVIVEGTGSASAVPVPVIQGLTPLASNIVGNKAFGLFRIEHEGLQLLKIAGAYSVRLFIAGDANRDTKVDGTDGDLLTNAMRSNHSPLTMDHSAMDANQDGVIDATDLHLYRQNLGYIPNQAPVVHPVTPVKTHIDLEVIKSVDQYITDQEHDPTTYRIVGATNGTARIASNGTSVSFTPTTGFFGTASFSIVADDGYATSQVATVTVNVSDAPLVKLDFTVRQPRIDARHSTTLELVGDFPTRKNMKSCTAYQSPCKFQKRRVCTIQDLSPPHGSVRAKSSNDPIAV